MAGALPICVYDNSLFHALALAGHDDELLGPYENQPIFAAVYDVEGRRYAYVGVAPRLSNGRVDVAVLGADQWLVEPGLVYEWDRGGRQPMGAA